MVIPPKVLNRLHLGRDVAAIIAASRPSFRAWIYIKPIIDPRTGTWTSQGTGEAYVRSDGENEPVKGYLVRYLEIDMKYLPYVYESDGYLRDPTTMDKKMIVPDDQSLEQILVTRLSDLSLLKIPSDVSCPDLPREYPIQVLKPKGAE